MIKIKVRINSRKKKNRIKGRRVKMTQECSKNYSYLYLKALNSKNQYNKKYPKRFNKKPLNHLSL